jgi:5-methylcytosine-specific restriction endonuclease McrBC regulatory subunit McrC
MILKIKSGTKIWIENLYHQELQTLLKSIKLDHLLYGNYLTIPQGNIGKIFTKNLEIIIEPSIEYLKTVDYLRLIITDKLVESKENILGFEKDNNIEKFIINQFIENLTKLVKQGIPPQYKHQEIESKYLHGNLNLDDSYLRIKLEIEPPFITSIHKMEIDYFVMRVIKQAYQKLILNFPSYQKPEITKILRYVSNDSVSIEKLNKNY